MSNLEDFKSFVKEHELLRNEVNEGRSTWQKLYENYTILGSDDESWEKYKVVKNERISKEGLGAILNYVKKINPDEVSKTINNVSKIVALIQGFGGNSAGKKLPTGDPLFDKKFDDWYWLI